MTRILIWDLPTRLFHWLFTATVLGALSVALIADDEGSVFRIHMLLGLIAGFLVLLRLVWGIAGSRYARFGSFLFGPKALVEYLVGAFRRTAERHVGHNPGSAYAIFAMLLLSLGLASSGLLLASWKGLEELHEILGFTMLAVVGTHLVGIILHTARHRENIALSMIHGRKEGEAHQGITSSHPAVGVIFLALALGCAAIVFKGYDSQTGQLSVLGQSFRLGESEKGASEDREDHHHRDRRGHRDGEREHHDREDRRGHHGEHDD
jgi:cytochrome b